MLNALLRELNNYFYRYTNGAKQYSFTIDCTFTSTNTIEGDFTDTFLVGEYIQVCDSRLNDAVYKIATISTTELTIDTTLDCLISTEPELACSVTKLFIPCDVIDLADEITDYNTNVTDGIASESQGNRSISYGSTSGWKNAFSTRISTYRRTRWC